MGAVGPYPVSFMRGCFESNFKYVIKGPDPSYKPIKPLAIHVSRAPTSRPVTGNALKLQLKSNRAFLQLHELSALHELRSWICVGLHEVQYLFIYIYIHNIYILYIYIYA